MITNLVECGNSSFHNTVAVQACDTGIHETSWAAPKHQAPSGCGFVQSTGVRCTAPAHCCAARQLQHCSFGVAGAQAVMTDPVVLGGLSYERIAAEHWLELHGAVSPKDGRPLPDVTLLPNHTLRAVLQAMGDTPRQ